jgi:hypothetical protein
MVLQLENPLVRNIIFYATVDQLLTVKKFGDTTYSCNSRRPDNFLLGRRGRVVVISSGPLKTLVLAPKNIQGIST